MLRISVTDKDIHGAECTTSKCPVARALSRLLGDVDFIFVNHEVIHITWVNKFGLYETARYKLSKRMKKFVKDFDSGRVVKPTVFYLWDFIHKKRQWKNTLGF